MSLLEKVIWCVSLIFQFCNVVNAKTADKAKSVIAENTNFFMIVLFVIECKFWN
jgi:hypothetical protein